MRRHERGRHLAAAQSPFGLLDATAEPPSAGGHGVIGAMPAARPALEHEAPSPPALPALQTPPALQIPPSRLPLPTDAVAGRPGPARRTWKAPARIGELAAILAPPARRVAGGSRQTVDRRLLPLLAAWCFVVRRLSGETAFPLLWHAPAHGGEEGAAWLGVAVDDASPFGGVMEQLEGRLAALLSSSSAALSSSSAAAVAPVAAVETVDRVAAPAEGTGGPGVTAAFRGGAPAAGRAAPPWPSPTLALEVELLGAEVRCRLCASQVALSRQRGRHILAQLGAVLEQAAADPAAALGTLSLLTPESLAVLPDPAAPLDQPELPAVLALFAAWAARAPAGAALVLPNRRGTPGERVITYGALSAAAAAVARRLHAAGLARGRVVAIHGRRSAGLIAAMLGVMAAGGALLILDAALPEERKALLMRLASASHLLDLEAAAPRPWAAGLAGITVVDADSDLDPDLCPAPPAGLAGTAEPSAPAIPSTLSTPSTPSTPSTIAAELAASAAGLAGDAPAYVFFTSGTTGRPKGVLGSHRGLSHFLLWQRDAFAVGPADRCAQLTHLAFDVMLRDVFLPLVSGAALCLPEGADERPDRVLAWLERQRVSLLHAVPSLARRWLDGAAPGLALASLRFVFFAGEPLPAALVAAWRRAFPRSGAQVNLYGPTETTLAKCAHLLGRELAAGIQPIGRPLPHTQVLVLAPGGRLCGVGEPGELVIRTPFRSLGYLEEPGVSHQQPSPAGAHPALARGFAPNPFHAVPGDLVYATGDRGRYRPDGSLDILGRADHQIKVRGVRVDPAEIEAALCSLDGVRQAVVAAREMAPGDTQLVAWVVCADPPAAAAAADLRRGLAAKLPSYLVPAWFVILPALPLNANGKLDRAALPDPGSAPRAGRAGAPPAGAMERRVASWWRSILGGVEAARDEDFFTLGGDSIKALRLAALAEQELGVEMPAAAIVVQPTIAAQASWLGRQAGRPAGHLVLGAGRQRQLFAFPPLLGYGLAYLRIAGFVPAHTIHAFDFLEEEEPIASYAEAVRREQPAGSYTLIGYSAGGNLAFEVAALLERGGAAVDAVIMLDAKRFVEPEVLADDEIEHLVWANLDHLAGPMLADEHFRELVRDDAARRRMAAKMRAFLRFERGRTNDGPIAADIHFIHSTNRPVCTSWAQATHGRFLAYQGSGDHLAMTQPPHAAVNGTLIAGILQDVKETDFARHRS
jgi:amino acid adenylation domain-containing protein